MEKELENAEQPVGGNEVVEHEASDKGLLRPGSPLPFSALMPHPQITAPVTQSSDAQFSPHPAVLFYSLITTLMYSFLKPLPSSSMLTLPLTSNSSFLFLQTPNQYILKQNVPPLFQQPFPPVSFYSVTSTTLPFFLPHHLYPVTKSTFQPPHLSSSSQCHYLSWGLFCQIS